MNPNAPGTIDGCFSRKVCTSSSDGEGLRFNRTVHPSVTSSSYCFQDKGSSGDFSISYVGFQFNSYLALSPNAPNEDRAPPLRLGKNQPRYPASAASGLLGYFPYLPNFSTVSFSGKIPRRSQRSLHCSIRFVDIPWCFDSRLKALDPPCLAK